MRVIMQIPEPRRHLVRYYGWYSNVSRGRRRKAYAEGGEVGGEEASARSRVARDEARDARTLRRSGRPWPVRRALEARMMACGGVWSSLDEGRPGGVEKEIPIRYRCQVRSSKVTTSQPRNCGPGRNHPPFRRFRVTPDLPGGAQAEPPSLFPNIRISDPTLPQASLRLK